MDSLDVFRLRAAVVDEYSDYARSFINIADPRIDEFVQGRLDADDLWPPASLQINPAFEMDATLGELVEEGILTPETARFFGENLKLYKHQREAIDLALKGESFIVATGTGSGKSLTYLVPIYDAIIREGTAKIGSARAMLVYPMNALINSQLNSLKDFERDNFPDSPVRFERYTGQEGREDRNRILAKPPHILLTNYMMAEYILTRPAERPLLRTATRDLRTLAMDELHYYRGRQGADAAMLSRRIQEKAKRDLQAIATSATMATGDTRDDRRRAASEVASKFFGLTIPPENVVDETIRRAIDAPKPVGLNPLREALEMDAPAPDEGAVRAHPLAAWAEEAFGIANENGRLVRRAPRTFAEAVDDLSRESGAARSLCETKLRALLDAAARMEASEVNRPLSFRLHQWLSSGDGVYATLEPAESRAFRMTGQYKTDGERLLFPLAFCRECGQDYYLARRTVEDGAEILLPRSPLHGGEEWSVGADGFFCLRSDGLWNGETGELPDFWFETTRSGVHRIKRNYMEAVPAGCAAKPDGALNAPDGAGAPGWFQPTPFMFCLRCFAVYDRRGSDYGKIASLSQVGRSTAATVAVNAAVFELSDQKMEKNETKALSFTDNRQDASLQAGHLNDFAQVALLRAGIVKAVERNGGRLEFAKLGGALFDALELRPSDFLAEPVSEGPGYSRGVRAMTNLLEYRALEDLGRGWRVTQPNLEQAGLLRIEYDGLRELAANGGLWRGLPAIGEADAERRETVLRALLDNLRTQLAINADPLKPESIRAMKRQISDTLRDPWRLEETDRLAERRAAVMPGAKLSEREKRDLGATPISLSRRSNIARYLRSRQTWDAPRDLSRGETEELILGIVNALKGHLLSVERGAEVRLMPNAMAWTAGNGAPPPLDPIRTRGAHLRRGGGETVNGYFRNLYREKASHLRGMAAAEHTGQVIRELREEREKRFGDGDLPALFCSPTMELGVDIRELRTVHMRNVPPTPANYAQRGGRAGRAGRPALIVAFAANGSAHDRYFFERREEMISGAVAPSRMDLKNEDLVRAHFHAVWLSLTGISLGQSVGGILDLESGDRKYPLLRAVKDALDDSRAPRDFDEAVDICRRVARRAEDIRGAGWFSDEWIKKTIRDAPSAFDKAFDDWRELYNGAIDMRDAARLETDAPKAKRGDKRDAEWRERQARRELEILRNEAARGESDFYPYRYLASAGFLPGYNFPRVTARISTVVRGETQYIGRTRFRSLGEFGPGNLVYHEGRKHRVRSAAPPLRGFDDGFDRARFCRECGCAQFGERVDADLCDHCGTVLSAENSDILQRLLEQPLMRTRVEERITSEEEARRRNGYNITTHFALSGKREETTAKTPDGEDVLGILRAPAARLWRVNRGWRRGSENGFSIDPKTGVWKSENSKNPSPEDISGVMTYATDFRNLLMLNPIHAERDESFDISLMHALKRAAEILYQVEENETEAELIGAGDHRRLLFWEEAEGGTGVWERLLDKSDGFREFRKLAEMALEVCHYDANGQPLPTKPGKETCEAACYDCLLTYSNQFEHRRIDRRLLPEFLMKLAEASAEFESEDDDRDERYRRLLALTDSGLEADFLRFLHENGLNLPDAAQNRPSQSVFAQPDFYYERDGRPGVCVFVDGPRHANPAIAKKDEGVRESLRDLGFRVVAINGEEPFDERIRAYPEVFGEGRL